MFKNMTKLTILSFLALTTIGNTICSEEASDKQMSRELIQAAKNADVERIEEILRRFPHLIDYEECIIPLSMAAFHGWQNVVETLLQRGAPIDKTVACDDTPLTTAARKGKTEIVRILLQHGANIEHREITGRTALNIAAKRGHFDTCRVLLQHGANIEATNDDDKTPLHEATEQGHVNTVKLLLEHGANVKARNDQGHTPLTWLFKDYLLIKLIPAEKKLAIIKLLISYGAEVTDEIDKTIRTQNPDYAPRIEAALLFERQRRTFLEHSSLPKDVANLLFSFQECYENQKCCQCSKTIRELLTPELLRVCSKSALHRICTECDQQRREHNDRNGPACSKGAQQ